MITRKLRKAQNDLKKSDNDVLTVKFIATFNFPVFINLRVSEGLLAIPLSCRN